MEIQKLERERFEDILALQANGEYDRAEQVSKIYDIYRQELDAKKQLANFDEESSRLENERAAKEQEAYKWLDKIDKLEEKRKYWKEQMRKLEEGETEAATAKEYDRRESKIMRNINSVEKQLDAVEAQAQKYVTDIDEGAIESLTRQRNRATLADKLNLDRDKLLWDYGKAIDAAGTDYGFKFSADYIKQNFEATQKSYTELHDIRQNTENLAEKLDQLLQMK